MSEEVLTHETRQPLGDLTNRTAKRAIPDDDDGSRFEKQLRLGVERFIREKIADDSGKGSSFETNDDTSQEVNAEGAVVGSLVSNQSGSSRSCEFLSRCGNLKDDVVGDDILKDCSCSFCLKAAYIWSDLQYQDIKGRIATLKKSQKEATMLALGCNGSGIGSDVESQGNPMKSSIGSDLTGHWKSLFSHMESQLANESNQLQSGFLKLKDLRENCKTDLENVNGVPSQKP